jgi:hypothetical protein
MPRKVTPTYVPLNRITLAANANSVTLSNIAQNYADLVLIVNIRTARSATGAAGFLRANSDSGSNYTRVGMFGAGSVGRFTNTDTSYYLQLTGNTAPAGMRSNNIVQLFDYSAIDKHKNSLIRQVEGNNEAVLAESGRWANTAAITSLTLQSSDGDFLSGSTISLYGIVA